VEFVLGTSDELTSDEQHFVGTRAWAEFEEILIVNINERNFIPKLLRIVQVEIQIRGKLHVAPDTRSHITRIELQSV